MRTDVYGQISGDHNTQSVGGRRNNTSVDAWINTDNATKSDCGIRVSGRVYGERSLNGRMRKTCHGCGYKWGEGHWDEGNHEWVPHEDDDRRECPQCGATRQGIDTRKSQFIVRLPDQTDDNCHIEITTPHHEATKILQFGAALVTVQGVMQQAEGIEKKEPELVQRGKVRIKQAMQLLEEHEAEGDKALPNVTLPGGVTLAHALACVALVERIVKGEAHSDS